MTSLDTLQPAAVDVLRALTVDQLIRLYDPQSVQRGIGYLQGGRVLGVRVNTGSRLTGVVVGSAARPYSVTIDLAADEGIIDGLCSCPMGADCKHVVAVLLSARAKVPAQAPSRLSTGMWERRLAGLTAQREAPTVLGLEVELTGRSGNWQRGRLDLLLRPLIPSQRKGWRKTGISWEDVVSAHTRLMLDAAQQEALAAAWLTARARQANRWGWYGQSPKQLELSGLGPAAFDLLDRVVQTGVVLVPAAGLASIVLSPEQASFRLDGRPTHEGLDLVPELVVPDVPPHSQVQPVGDPAGVVIVAVSGPSRPGSEATPLGRGSQVRLHRLAVPLDQTTRRFLDEGTVHVPAAAIGRFRRAVLPGLRRTVEVSGDSPWLHLPEVSGPTLAVRVEVLADDELAISCAWRYRVDGTDVIDVEPGRSPGQEVEGLPDRDLPGENALARALDYLVGHLAGRDRDGSVSVREDTRLRGVSTARFVTDVLPRLAEDARVELEVVGQPKHYQESLEAPQIEVTTEEDPDPTRTDWFDLGVTVRVGGELVPFGPLFSALAEGRSSLLLASGTWFSLDRPELVALRDLIEEARGLQDRTAQESGRLQLSPLHAGLWQELMGIGVVGEQAAGWAASVSALLNLDTATPPAPPDGLQAELRPYQERGFQWVSQLWEHRLGGILADDMGLGKTLQLLAAVAWARDSGQLRVDGRPAPVLVVCPTSVIGTWEEQAARFTPDLRVACVTATKARRESSVAELAAGADLVVTSYTLLRLEGAAYEELPWSAMVLDEAQAVKNFRAKTYGQVRRIRATTKVAVTGTPLENSLMDLWALLSIVAPGLYPDPDRFTEEYRRPIEVGRDQARLARLRRRIGPLMLRRRKEEVAPELPPKVEQVLHVELGAAQRRVYNQHLQRERQRVLGMLDDVNRNRMAIFRALTTLRQLSLAPVLVDADQAKVGSAKLDALLESLQEVLAEGHRALVFSQFTGFLRLLRDRLDAAGVGYAYLDGRTRNRAAAIERFRAGDDPLFLISLKAGGFGLTLTEADYVFVLDPWWNPAAEAQAVDRTHRIGQDKTVMVYRLVAADTIEDKVVALQERKRRLFEDVVEGGDGIGGALTADDIRALLDH